MELTNTTELQVIQAIRQLELPLLESTELTLDTDLADDLGLDSVAFVQLVVNLEALFAIQIAPELLLFENFGTVEQICELMERIQNDDD